MFNGVESLRMMWSIKLITLYPFILSVFSTLSLLLPTYLIKPAFYLYKKKCSLCIKMDTVYLVIVRARFVSLFLSLWVKVEDSVF